MRPSEGNQDLPQAQPHCAVCKRRQHSLRYLVCAAVHLTRVHFCKVRYLRSQTVAGPQHARFVGRLLVCTPVKPWHDASLNMSSMISAGAEDGSVAAFDLAPHRLGQRLCEPLHVHTGPVVRLQAPPGGAGAPWDACVLSVGADCAVCIVSLLQQSALRVFSGAGHALAFMPTLRAPSSCHRVDLFRLCCSSQRSTSTCGGLLLTDMSQRPLPAGVVTDYQVVVAGHPSVPSSAAWDPVRGYLACLCPGPTDVSANGTHPLPSSAVAIVWDVHSGRLYVQL